VNAPVLCRFATLRIADETLCIGWSGLGGGER
jgi:hypothetical protein